MTSTVSVEEAFAISSARSTAAGVSIIAQTEVWSGAPASARASSTLRTSSAEPTFGTTTASGPTSATARTSASCHWVSMPLTRTATSRRPYGAAATVSHTRRRAASLAPGATASSRSSTSASAARASAFFKARSFAPGR